MKHLTYKSEGHSTFDKIIQLHYSFPNDIFVQALLASTPPNYEYLTEDSDDELLIDALREKYFEGIEK